MPQEIAQTLLCRTSSSQSWKLIGSGRAPARDWHASGMAWTPGHSSQQVQSRASALAAPLNRCPCAHQGRGRATLMAPRSASPAMVRVSPRIDHVLQCRWTVRTLGRCPCAHRCSTQAMPRIAKKCFTSYQRCWQERQPFWQPPSPCLPIVPRMCQGCAMQ